jgi:hypothetical protein
MLSDCARVNPAGRSSVRTGLAAVEPGSVALGVHFDPGGDKAVHKSWLGLARLAKSTIRSSPTKQTESFDAAHYQIPLTNAQEVFLESSLASTPVVTACSYVLFLATTIIGSTKCGTKNGPPLAQRPHSRGVVTCNRLEAP